MQLPDYPVLHALGDLRAALRTRGCAVLSAPPGSGKTTVVPLALLEEKWLGQKKILMLEPRRVATRASAARMAHLCGEKAGQTVGYQVRFERRVSHLTRIEVITEGLLTRRLQTDPELPDVGLVIFDEFHERSLDADLALALTLDAKAHLNPELRVLIMSATLESQRVAQLLGDAPQIEAHGKMFPVSLKYLGQNNKARQEDQVAGAVQAALVEQSGDILVFLPGAREIRDARDLLEKRHPELAVRALHGALSNAEQDQALMPDARKRRKIILATNIAQTSLTVEGVTTVIDAGQVRAARFDLGAGANRLETFRVSRASAEQRAGRAGRLAPGSAYRLWSQDQHGALAAQDTPEILAADLSRLALELAVWGIADPAQLKWLDLPPTANWDYARDLLQSLGAIDLRGRITDHGKLLARLPTTPRLAHLLLSARDLGAVHSGVWLAAALDERPVHGCSDLAEHVRQVAQGRNDPSRRQRVRESVRQFLRLLGEKREKEFSEEMIGMLPRLIALTFPERLARRRDGLRESAATSARNASREVAFQCVDGGEARLPEHDPLARESWLAVAHWTPGAQRRVQLAAGLSEEQVREYQSAQLNTQDEVRWDAQLECVIAQKQERLGNIVLSAQRLESHGDAALAAMLHGVRAMGLGCLPWTQASEQWRLRLMTLARLDAQEAWPDVSDAALLEHLENWLAPYLDDCGRRSHLQKLDLSAILNAMLDYPQQQRLAKLAPGHVIVASGQHRVLRYQADGPPILEVKLQEMFGSNETPRVCEGKLKVLLHLLSPARRPVAVTDDLEGFWKGAYQEVRKDLRGRYPRHPWPENPLEAEATHRAKPRGT